jgi:hypothetical protein
MFYDDDSIEYIEGEAAEQWLEAITGPILLQQARGYSNEALKKANENWKMIIHTKNSLKDEN